MIDLGVLILGGGEATRLPGKLALAAGDVPMIVRVYRNVAPGRETVIACKETFDPAIDAMLPCPMVVDRWSRRGPLAGMLTTMGRMRSRFIFAVAGDAPFVDGAFIAALAARYEDGDEALVPSHPARDGKAAIEPLAAIYDRLAFLREGIPVLRSGNGALRGVIDRLQTRYVPVGDERTFANVNTAGEYALLREELGLAG